MKIVNLLLILLCMGCVMDQDDTKPLEKPKTVVVDTVFRVRTECRIRMDGDICLFTPNNETQCFYSSPESCLRFISDLPNYKCVDYQIVRCRDYE